MPTETDRCVRLPLDPEDHQKFREIAAREGVPMSVVAKRVITRFLSEREVARPAEARERRTAK
jgi:hypothetical protein